MSVESFVYCPACGWEGIAADECPDCGHETKDGGTVIY